MSVPPSKARWAVLAALMAVTLACEAQWLVHAAVARPAAEFYAGQFDPGSLFNIDALALVYMLVFLVAALPASWMIERWGLGMGVGVGAVLTLVGSVGKGVFAASFAAQLGFQLVLALAQPFLINAATTLARQWFAPGERATAVGLASLAQYLGFVVALTVAPALVHTDPGAAGYGAGVDTALAVFGVLGVVTALAALVLVRRGPLRDDKAPEAFGRSLVSLVSSPNFLLTALMFFLGLGILNAVTSLTDAVAASLGVTDSNGLLGVGLIAGGILGAIALPLWSDHVAVRKPFLMVDMALAAVALGLLVTAPGGYFTAVAAMALLGFALMSAGPIGFQYAAETTQASEAVSQGLLLLVGQVSGLAFTAGMSLGGPSTLGWWMGGFALVCFIMASLVPLLKEDRLRP